jgi:DNA replication initiation complex subunit (GINS family)
MQDEEGINYRNLRKIQQMEKSSTTLTNIKTSFYDELKKYLEKIDNLLLKETSSQKKKILEDEIENTKKILYNIYEQREKKILLATISKIRGGNPDLTNIIETEKDLFDSISSLLQKSREKFFEKKYENHLVSNEQKKDIINKYVKIEEEQISNINPIVIVNDDIPEFIGTDEKKYVLRKNDVLSIPKDMCKMLLKRGVVKKFE